MLAAANKDGVPQLWKNSEWADTLVFGPSAATPEGYRWGEDQLTGNQTEGYEALIGKGLDKEAAYAVMKNYDGRTNASKALSILTVDADNDGRKDFNDSETKDYV